MIGGHQSEHMPVASGVPLPTSSILGPFIFVMFINDMFDCISDKTNIALYADDTKIWLEIIVWDDHLALQNDIDNLLRWANINKMTFHPQKCKVVSVAKNSFEPILPFQLFIYELGGTLLDYASSEKDLGVIVNTTLTFDDQCNDRYSTMNQKLRLLRRVCYFTKDQKKNEHYFWL